MYMYLEKCGKSYFIYDASDAKNICCIMFVIFFHAAIRVYIINYIVFLFITIN